MHGLMTKDAASAVAYVIKEVAEGLEKKFADQLEAVRKENTDLHLIVEVLSGQVADHGTCIEALNTRADLHANELEDSSKQAADFLLIGSKIDECGQETDRKIDEILAQVNDIIEQKTKESSLSCELFLEQAKNQLSDLKSLYLRDSESISKLQPIDGRTFQEGAYGRYGSSLYRSKITTDLTPADDPGLWELIAGGIDDLSIDVCGRDVLVSCTVPSGKEVSKTIARTMEHMGPYKSDTTYSKNDIVMSNGSSWICVVDETKSRPGEQTDSPEWRLMSMRGKRGEKGQKGDNQVGDKGERGKDGKDGIGIVDVQFDNAAMVVATTDGDVKRWDLGSMDGYLRSVAADAARDIVEKEAKNDGIA